MKIVKLTNQHNFKRGGCMSEEDDYSENVYMHCDDCSEEYLVPEDTIKCPFCNGDNINY